MEVVSHPSAFVVALFPFFVPLTEAVIGGALGHYVSSRLYRGSSRSRAVPLAGLWVLGVIAALIPNVGQLLSSIGLSLAVVDLLQDASYFVFGFTMVSAWKLLAGKWQRWLLALLVPVSFAQPMLWTMTYLFWSIRGFAP